MNRRRDSFTPQSLLQILENLPSCKRWLVGFSGGADSTALLLALHQLTQQHASPFNAQLEAVHFNHGLQSQADTWERHCRLFCQQREIPLQVHQLSVQYRAHSSPETAAREARYRAIARLLEEGDMYLTAHQANDQAETLFLNLMRGSGAEGLAGIPPLREFAAGRLARPLLIFHRAALEDYLRAENVDWILDPSNQDFGPDRNFLRGSIFPQLEQRWPGVIARLSHTARHLRDHTAAFKELLRPGSGYVSEDGITLPVEPLAHCSPQLQAEIIRNWTSLAGARPPPRARLQEFLRQLQDLRHGSRAEIRWNDHLIKHHDGSLWMQELPGPAACPAHSWDMGKPLELGPAHGHLLIEGGDLLPRSHAWVCSRSALQNYPELDPSERKKLKEIMRISGIPYWLRDTVPLLYLGRKLSAVGDWWLAREFRQELAQAHLSYRWEPEHRLLKKIQAVCHNLSVDPTLTLV